MAVVIVAGLAAIEHVGQTKSVYFLRHAISDEAQRNLLSTLGEVSATFLGLYFAAIGIVASSATYARAPDEIRTLIMSELLGNVTFEFWLNLLPW